LKNNARRNQGTIAFGSSIKKPFSTPGACLAGNFTQPITPFNNTAFQKVKNNPAQSLTGGAQWHQNLIAAFFNITRSQFCKPRRAKGLFVSIY